MAFAAPGIFSSRLRPRSELAPVPYKCSFPSVCAGRPELVSCDAVYRDRRITVVIPCLNEEAGIVQVLSRMPAFVDEIIVVDNDSTDRTAEMARRHGAFVIHEKIRGYGRAYKTGLIQAQGDIVVTLDGDHSYPVDAISYLLEVFLHSRERFLSARAFL